MSRRGILIRDPDFTGFTYRRFRVPTPAPADTGADNTPGRLVWGQLGTVPTPEVAESMGFEVVNCDETHIETDRISEKIKIENPDEPEDWVEVDRAKKYFFNKTEKKYGKPSNTSASEPEGLEYFHFEPIVWESFKPEGSEEKKRCRLAVSVKNTQIDA